MFAVVVTFSIKAGQMPAFMPLMLDNAVTSLRDESGCHRFDVCTDPDRPDEVFLYELYSDQAAFEAHLASQHFKTFNAAVSSMIADKSARTFRDVAQ